MRALVALVAAAVAVEGITIDKATAVANQNGDIVRGVLSYGYFNAPAKTTVTMHGSAMMNLGQMTSFLMNPPATLDMEDASNVQVGSYSLYTLDKNCKFSMSRQSSFLKFQNAQDGRSEFYCNSTFSMGGSSFLTMQPQSLIYTQSPVTIGKAIYVNLKQGATLKVLHTLIIQDFAVVNLEEQARLDILSTATGVVQITSSTATPPNPTSVHLFPSSKIINEGQMTIGGGQATKVKLMKSGLLKIGPKGTFTIKSSTFDIGPSSFWIINGTFSFDEGSSLSSGLQSNITVGATGTQEAGTFKTLTGGNVTVGAGGSLQLTGVAQITGDFTLAPSAHVSIPGELRMTDKSASFQLNYASTADIIGRMTVGPGVSVSVGSSAGLFVGSTASLNLMGGALSMGERSYLAFKFPKSQRCAGFGAVSIKSYTAHIITTPAEASKLGFICG